MSHPRIYGADELQTPSATAAALGYRMPAEWEPQACVWVTPPHNPETWPGCLYDAKTEFATFVEALADSVPVNTTDELAISTNDSWMRDFGPLFVVRDHGAGPAGGASAAAGSVACHDFHFNGWGNKYELRQQDDLVPQELARQMGVPVWVHDFVLEGGAIEVNGRGTVLTTESCLLNPNRNPGLSRRAIEQKLHETLGTRVVIWLPGGIEGDDTDGHVDDVARFVSPTIVAAVSAPSGHPDHDLTQRNLAALRAGRDQDGTPLDIIELPAPPPIEYDYPTDRFGAGGRAALPASYANFLISNGRVFLPVFGQWSDDAAVKCLDPVMPDHTIVPLRAEHLIVGLGAFHCLSMPQPIPVIQTSCGG